MGAVSINALDNTHQLGRNILRTTTLILQLIMLF